MHPKPNASPAYFYQSAGHFLDPELSAHSRIRVENSCLMFSSQALHPTEGVGKMVTNIGRIGAAFIISSRDVIWLVV